MNYQSHRSLILSLILALSWTGAVALESDKRQDIQFRADGDTTVTTRDGLRTIEMKTNVRVTQGSLEIMGNAAIFEYDAAGEVSRVTVHGTPVHYQQQLDTEGQVVKGTSETILFYTDTTADETILELIGKANIQSPDSAMTCATIVYLADQDIIREATGPCEGVLNTRSN